MTLMRTDYLRIDSVVVNAKGGEIGMTMCPGRQGIMGIPSGQDRDLEGDLRVIVNWGGRTLVSLIEPYEFELLQVTDLSWRAEALGLEWHYIPIRDMGVPDLNFERAWAETGPRLRETLSRGERIVLHCLAGLGRTGTIAARLLVEFGMKPEKAIRTVRAARPGTIQTKTQEVYVRRCKPVQL